MTFLGRIRYYLTRPISPFGADSEVRTLRCRKEDVSISHATHEVYHITTDTEDGYFRECPKRGNDYNVWDANKVMAYEAVAKLCGLSHLVTPTTYARVQIDEKEMLGYYQDRADGICIIGLTHEKRRRILTPQFQRAMNSLNFLDALCHEDDHSPNNYNVVLDDTGLAVGIAAFDNNGCRAGAESKEAELFQAVFCTQKASSFHADLLRLEAGTGASQGNRTHRPPRQRVPAAR